MSLWSYDPFLRRTPVDRFFDFDDQDELDLFFDTFHDAFWNRKRARDAQLATLAEKEASDSQKKRDDSQPAQKGGEVMNANVSQLAQRQPFTLQDLTPVLNSDLVETANGFEVHADVPGIDPNDLDISIIDPRTIVIKAERKRSFAGESADHKVHTRERSYGQVQRRIRLPATADLEGAKSSLKNGVLTIAVPKKTVQEGPSLRKIAISTD